MAAALSGANVRDMKVLRSALDSKIIRRTSAEASIVQHFCGDKGYDYPEIRRLVQSRGYVVRIPRSGEDVAQARERKHPALRWVVERTNRWHNLFRRLKTRYEVYERNYLAFVHLTSAIICFNSAHS